MSFVFELIVVIHLIGMACIVGSYLTVVRRPRMVPLMLHGAATQVITGLIMVGMLEAKVVEEDEEINHAKIGAKLLVALFVLALAWVNRKRDDEPNPAVHAIGGLAILNVMVAALWS